MNIRHILAILSKSISWDSPFKRFLRARSPFCFFQKGLSKVSSFFSNLFSGPHPSFFLVLSCFFLCVAAREPGDGGGKWVSSWNAGPGPPWRGGGQRRTGPSRLCEATGSGAAGRGRAPTQRSRGSSAGAQAVQTRGRRPVRALTPPTTQTHVMFHSEVVLSNRHGQCVLLPCAPWYSYLQVMDLTRPTLWSDKIKALGQIFAWKKDLFVNIC